MTRTTVSRGNRTAGRSNGANPFSPLRQENREVTFPPSVGGVKLSLRDALSRARWAHCSVYRCNLLFNPRIRVCRIVLSPPLPAALSLCSPPTPPPPVWCGYTCARLHLQPPTCAIPSAIGNTAERRRRRRFIAPSLRPSFRLPRRQSTPRVALSSSSPLRRFLLLLLLRLLVDSSRKMLVPRT